MGSIGSDAKLLCPFLGDVIQRENERQRSITAPKCFQAKAGRADSAAMYVMTCHGHTFPGRRSSASKIEVTYRLL